MLRSASDVIMKLESLLTSTQSHGRATSPHSGTGSGRVDVSPPAASHSVLRLAPRQADEPAYDLITVLDPATRAAQKYTPLIMVTV